MKRREFIIGATGSASMLLLNGAKAAPCPPPSFAGVPAVCPISTDSPEWVQTAIDNGWQPGEWLAVSGSSPTTGYGLSPTNTLLDVNSAGDSESQLDEGFIHSWTGATLASGHREYGTYIMGPGGSHGNYSKGTIYLFDLGTRTWEEVAGADNSGLNQSLGEYNSGRAITNHSASWPFYDSFRNEMAYPKGWGDPTSGSDQFPAPYGHGLDLAAVDSNGYSDSHWRRYPELTGITSSQLTGLGQQCGCAWDESRRKVWLLSANNSSSSTGVCASYDSAANSWTVHERHWSVFLHSAFAIDPIRDILVIPDGGTFDKIRLFDLKNPDTRLSGPTSTDSLWSAIQTGSGIPSDTSQWGWEWSSALGGFVMHKWGAGANTVKLAKYAGGGSSLQSGVNSDYTLNWSTLTAGSNAVSVPARVSGGSFKKFRLATWGNIEVAFFVPGSARSVYAFRVS